MRVTSEAPGKENNRFGRKGVGGETAIVEEKCFCHNQKISNTIIHLILLHIPTFAMVMAAILESKPMSTSTYLLHTTYFVSGFPWSPGIRSITPSNG